jgi:signal transduction histidine kinase
MCKAVAALRFVTLAWGATVLAIDTNSGVLTRPWAAGALLALVFAWSLLWTVATSQRRTWVNRWGVAVDVALASTVMVADLWVYTGDHPQSLASGWPLVVVIAVGVVRGTKLGTGAGVVVGLANLAGAWLLGVLDGNVMSTCGTLVLLTAGGWGSGTLAGRLKDDAVALALADAREDMARTLHDGVLQTLAVVQRRSKDDELVALAREQELELRALITATGAQADQDVVTALTALRAGWEQKHHMTVQLVVIDPGDCQAGSAGALVAATGEAVTNAAKHSGALTVVVSVDRGEQGGTVVVVHDEGGGYDMDTTGEGIGLARSIRGRLAEVNGTVDVTSAVGTGCEVTLWAP